MSGFLDFLSPALTVGTQAAGAYEQAKAQSAERNQDNFLKSALLLKQQHDAEINDQLRGAQTEEARARTGELGAQTNRINNPLPLREIYHPIDPNSPAGIAAAIAKRPPPEGPKTSTTTTRTMTIRPHVAKKAEGGAGVGFHMEGDKFVVDRPGVSAPPPSASAPRPAHPAEPKGFDQQAYDSDTPPGYRAWVDGKTGKAP